MNDGSVQKIHILQYKLQARSFFLNQEVGLRVKPWNLRDKLPFTSWGYLQSFG